MKYLLAILLSSAAVLGADRQVINIGVSDNDTSGDSRRQTAQKVNANFADLYLRVGNATSLFPGGNVLSIQFNGTNRFAGDDGLKYDPDTQSLLVSGLLDSPSPVNGTVNVKSHLWGAAGDGDTDDTEAIQAAVDYCAANPGVELLFPPSDSFYKLTSTIVVTNGFRIRGNGAILKGIGNVGYMLALSNFNNGTIEGLTFETDQTGLTQPVLGLFSQSDQMNNVKIVGNTFSGQLKVALRNANNTAATCSNLWIYGNAFLTDLTGVSGEDNGNVLDVRGFIGPHITGNNWLTKGEMEMAKVSNSGRDTFIEGNLFRSVGPPTPGGPCIDTFANNSRLHFIGNHFVTTNYGDILVAKPTASAFSEQDQLLVQNNIFEYTSDTVSGAPVNFYGAWGLADQTLSNSIVNISGNLFKVDAPDDLYALVVARGFTHVELANNTIARVERTANAKSMDASNSRDIVITGNNLEGGGVIIADMQSNPPGTTYTNCPQTITFTGNTVLGVPSFGCLWLTTLTNQDGLRSLVVAGNTLYPTPYGTNANAAIIRADNCIIQDMVVAGNVGASDFGDLYLVNGTVVNGNRVYANNSWQQNSAVPYVTPTSLTNYVVNFADGDLQYIQLTTNAMNLSVSNAVTRAHTTVRVHSPDAGNSVSYDSQIAVVGPRINWIPQFSTLALDFYSTATGNTNANVVLYAHLYPDPITIEQGFIHADREIVSDGIVAAGTQFYANGSAGITTSTTFTNSVGLSTTLTFTGGILTGLTHP